MAALVGFASMIYGAYVLVRLVMALTKKQEVKPWGLKLGAAFLIFVLSSSTVSSDSSKSSMDTSAATSPVQQKTTEELEREKQEKERQVALNQRKKEQEQRRNEEQRKQQEWANKQESMQEQKRKEEQERNKYQAINISTLLGEIRSNAARAKRNYNGKYIKTQGIILTIESDGDNVMISDGEYNITPAVHCLPSRNNKSVREKIFNLNKGQYVTVYGKITDIGEVMGCYLELEKIE